MENNMKVQIVPMNGDHLDEVAELERVCFPDPWSRNMLKEELENDLAAFLVALDGQGAVAGSRWCWTRAIFSTWRSGRTAAAGEWRGSC